MFSVRVSYFGSRNGCDLLQMAPIACKEKRVRVCQLMQSDEMSYFKVWCIHGHDCMDTVRTFNNILRVSFVCY